MLISYFSDINYRNYSVLLYHFTTFNTKTNNSFILKTSKQKNIWQIKSEGRNYKLQAYIQKCVHAATASQALKIGCNGVVI